MLTVIRSIQFQTELWEPNKGTISDHFYTSTRFVLSKADPDFGKTGRRFGKGKASGTPAQTTDGGKTWTITKVALTKMRTGTPAG
jgi:Neuraminidase (sialidase)